MDFIFIACLILLGAFPLIVLNKNLWISADPLLPFVTFAWIGVAAIWLRRKQPSPAIRVSRRYADFGRILVTSAGLLLFAIVTFYLPMQKEFWNSTDEEGMLTLVKTTPLSQVLYQSDNAEARPLEMVGVELGQGLSPEAVDGFLWLAFMLRCASAVLVFGIVQETFRIKSTALIAALLFMVNPSEPWRYIVIVMMDYYLALFLFLLSAWLFLISYRRQKRWMLLGACSALIFSLLIRESSLLLALIVPVLLFTMRREGRRRGTWCFGWLATVALMGSRLALFWLTTPDSYQSHFVQRLTSAAQVADSLRSQFALTLSYLNIPDLAAFEKYWPFGLLALILAAGLVWLKVNPPERPSRKRCGVGILLAAAGISLAIAPYFAFSQPARTQFCAAPAQAIGLALVIGGVGAFLGRRLRLGWEILATGILVVSATVGGLQFQADQARTNPPFEQKVQIFDQVHHLAPKISPDTLVLLVSSDGRSPFTGRAYQLILLSRLALGVDMYQGNVTDAYGRRPTFAADGITLLPDIHEPPGRVTFYPYDRVLAFQMTLNSTVVLLDTFPGTLLPVGISARGYAPRARFQPGDPAPLPYLHFSHWMTRYQPPPDIVDAKRGIVLGENWFDLEQDAELRWRWVDDNAELFVDGPNGDVQENGRDISIDLEPATRPDNLPLVLQVMGENGQVFQTVEISQRTTIHLTLPVNPGHTRAVWLHRLTGPSIARGDPRRLGFRVFRIW